MISCYEYDYKMQIIVKRISSQEWLLRRKQFRAMMRDYSLQW